MAIKRLVLKDFRGFEALDLSFDPRLTVLVGRNGSGKTSVLDAIVIARGRGPEPADVRSGAEQATLKMITDDGSVERTLVGGSMHGQGNINKGLWLFYRVGRSTKDQTPGSTAGERWTESRAMEGYDDAAANYRHLFTWLREMEDLENEKVRYGEKDASNPQLDSVRYAVTSFLQEFSSMRVRREFPPLSTKPVLTFQKGDTALPFDSFSEGERNAIAMVADIARRLSLLGSNGHGTQNALEREGTVLIDEIEQHLHPAWQRRFVRQLPKTFPGLQFIVTTQSPVVVSEVPATSLRVLKDFRLVEGTHRQGRDANSVLEETFETSARPEESEKALERLAQLLDDRKIAEAEKALVLLERDLGKTDADLVYYRNIFERLRAPG